MGFIDKFINDFISRYESFLSDYSPETAAAINVFFLAILIVIAAYFIWKFYNSLSKRNVIRLNLMQYNMSEHAVAKKIFAIMLYFVEYIIVMPVIIAIWFGALSLLLLLISERAPFEVMAIAGAMVGAIRILAYFNKEISKDLAKLFPFIVLSIFLLSARPFDIEKLTTQVNEIPVLFDNVVLFLFVIFLIEVVLRLFYTIYEFWRSEDVREIEEERIKRQVDGGYY